MLNPTEEEEALADRFYAAREYVIRQAELVTYFLHRQHPVFADKAVKSLLQFTAQWNDLPWAQTELQLVYRFHRTETERRYRDAA